MISKQLYAKFLVSMFYGNNVIKILSNTILPSGEHSSTQVTHHSNINTTSEMRMTANLLLSNMKNKKRVEYCKLTPWAHFLNL